MDVETRGLELRRERLAFEIHWHVCQSFWNPNAAALKQVPFPLLRGRVIHLKDTQPRVRISIGEGVEARAEQNILSNAGSNGPAQVVLGIPAASHQKGPQRNGERPIGPAGSSS